MFFGAGHDQIRNESERKLIYENNCLTMDGSTTLKAFKLRNKDQNEPTIKQ